MQPSHGGLLPVQVSSQEALSSETAEPNSLIIRNTQGRDVWPTTPITAQLQTPMKTVPLCG